MEDIPLLMTRLDQTFLAFKNAYHYSLAHLSSKTINGLVPICYFILSAKIKNESMNHKSIVVELNRMEILSIIMMLRRSITRNTNWNRSISYFLSSVYRMHWIKNRKRPGEIFRSR